MLLRTLLPRRELFAAKGEANVGSRASNADTMAHELTLVGLCLSLHLRSCERERERFFFCCGFDFLHVLLQYATVSFHRKYFTPVNVDTEEQVRNKSTLGR